MNLFSIDELSAPATNRAIREIKKDDFFFSHTREKILNECIAEIAIPRWLFSILFADVRKDVNFPRIEIGRLNIHAENPKEIASVVNGLGLTGRLADCEINKLNVSYSWNGTGAELLEVSIDSGIDVESVLLYSVHDLVRRINAIAVKKFEKVYSVDAIMEHIDEFDRVFDIDGELIV